MDFTGEIVFAVSDIKRIDIDFGLDFLPTKIIKKGDEIVLGRKSSQYRWLHTVRFNNEKEYLENFNKLINQLYEKLDYVNQVINKYEKVCIDIYIRSDYAEIGYSLPNYLLKKLALIECTVNYNILSFGMTINEEHEGI